LEFTPDKLNSGLSSAAESSDEAQTDDGPNFPKRACRNLDF